MFSIYMAYESLDLLSQFLVRIHFRPSGDGQLDQAYLADPVWVFGQKPVKGHQLLRYAFDIVKTVDSKNNLSPLEASFQLGKLAFNTLTLHLLPEALRLDSNRKAMDNHFPITPMQVCRRPRDAPGKSIREIYLLSVGIVLTQERWKHCPRSLARTLVYENQPRRRTTSFDKFLRGVVRW